MERKKEKEGPRKKLVQREERKKRKHGRLSDIKSKERNLFVALRCDDESEMPNRRGAKKR